MSLRRVTAHPAALAALAALGLAGCGGASRVPLPLRPEPVSYADTLPIPEPEAREPLEAPKLFDDALAGEVSRVLGIRRAAGRRHEALNVTRFDDVVPSAWFEPRNAVRRLSPEEVFRGPTTSAGPDTDGPLEIVSAKVQGISPGFNIRDSRGDRYVVKFDPKGFLHLSSAAGVISNRLLHAAGWHVPEDYVLVFSKERLAVAEGATIRGEDSEEGPLTLAAVLEVLALTDSLPDGRYLAVASKFVPGPPKGPFYFDGVREDDPNDHYRHEHRRDLRGLYVVSSWLNHVDMRWMNTMDAYVEPGYLRHYLIDFAATLGSGTIRPHEPREGLEYNADFWASMGRLVTLGFYRVGWEDRQWEVIDPSIGWLEAEEFEPGRWKANWPNAAFSRVTARDGYWGAKIVGSFTDEQIRAAVRAGRLPSESAADTLARVLVARRDRIVDHWYRRVTPLERFEVVPGGTEADACGASLAPEAPAFVLAFDDLGLGAGLWTTDGITYAWELEHAALGRSWTGVAPAVDCPVRGEAARRALLIAPDGRKPGRDPGRRLAGGDALATLRLQGVLPDGTELRPLVVWLRRAGDAPGYTVAGLEH
ncbi:MAG: hypothetical protein R6X22_02675 [Gemmatimonadota bacterium]